MMPRFLFGPGSPAVVVPARIARMLEGSGALSQLRTRASGVDPEAWEVLDALRLASEQWTGDPLHCMPVREKIDPDLALTSAEIAIQIGISDRAVRRAMRDGELEAQMVGGRWIASREAFEHYRAGRRQRGLSA